MQASKKTKKLEDELTDKEMADIKQYRIDKANGKTKRYTLEELLKELHD